MRTIVRVDTKLKDVVKGKQLEGVQKQYSLNELFQIVSEDVLIQELGIDELMLHDSVASLYNWDNYFIQNNIIPYCGRPLTISGGIKSVEHGMKLLKKCERICLNTEIHKHPGLLNDLSAICGAQSVSVELQVLETKEKDLLLSCNGKIPVNTGFQDCLLNLQSCEFGELCLMNVKSDGMESGLNFRIAEIARNIFPNKSIVLGGGVADFSDTHVNNQLIDGIVVSTAFHVKARSALYD